jgi:PAS domain S-box-containing protein
MSHPGIGATGQDVRPHAPGEGIDMAEGENLAGQMRWEGELLRLLAENSTEYAIFLLDLDGVVLTWNPGAQRVLGYREEEILGRSSFIIFTPEDREKGEAMGELQSAKEQGQVADERWHVRKDGSRFWASGILTLLRDDTGEPRALAKVLRDFTDRKLAEQSARESEERLRVALAAARMGTWRWEIPADRWTLDESLRELFGLERGATIGTKEDFLRLVHAEDRDLVRQAIDRGVRDGGDFNVEFRVNRPDGSECWLKDQGRVFGDERGRPSYMTGACMDITDRKRMEDALREADRSKDEFLAMLAHELRNPLAPIRITLELIRLESLAGADLEESHAMIDRQVVHLTRLVDDLLDVSRITRGKIELHRGRVELTEAARTAVEMVDGYVRRRDHELLVSMPQQPVWFDADATRLTQVIFNLLHNAAKYTDPGGKIWLTAAREGHHVVIRVRDTGMGIPAELLPRVFDLFTQGERTLDRSQGGLGLGLTLVKRLAEMHGGSAEAHSEGPGKGSEFVIRLPAPTT